MNKAKTRKILLLPGDGIGPEVVREVKKTLEWFNKNDIEFINSIPSSNFEDDDDNLFSKKSKGDLYSRVINQLSMIFNNLGSDGGLFILIGKKNQ